MKKVFSILAAVLLTATLWAQSPEKMSYQAVVHDGSNNLVTSTAVGMQISILQGSASRTPVYVETQMPTTNPYGLVSIQIGAGTLISGDFTTIDWANGPYFIKTEIDPTGGTSYTITGTSQLLSVPFALHAKTAESITGTSTETDPVFGASVASGITGPDTTNWNNKLDSYTETDPVFGASAASGITGTDTTNWNNKQDPLTAGTGIDITGKVVSATSGVTTYSVGDFAQGGIVFWVDETGQHGLVAAKEDQSTGVRWYAGTETSTMARGDGLYAGELNTAIIIANQGYGDGGTYAARVCNELKITEGGVTYGDWYLPSKEELNLMYQNKAAIDATAGANGGSSFASGSSAYYWSSTEEADIFVFQQYFDGGLESDSRKNKVLYVRAVRAF